MKKTLGIMALLATMSFGAVSATQAASCCKDKCACENCQTCCTKCGSACCKGNCCKK